MIKPIRSPNHVARCNRTVHFSTGESGWIVQFDVRAKVILGYVQVYYKDQPASALIPFATHGSCFENMLIVDIQQTKPLP